MNDRQLVSQIDDQGKQPKVATPLAAGERSDAESAGQSEKGSRPVSRVLSRAVIHLGRPSPDASSDLPGSSCGRTQRFPIRSCSRWGLPCRSVLPRARCALTAPFHPYRTNPAVCFLLHWPWARAPQALPGTLPMEPGLSSGITPGDCSADSLDTIIAAA
jgi:hypothetical protein